MKRIYTGWLFAGLAMMGQSGANLAYGQASTQGSPPAAASAPQSMEPMPDNGGITAIPIGYQAPGKVSPQAIPGSPSKSVPIPIPRSGSSFFRGKRAKTSPYATQAPQGVPGGQMITGPSTMGLPAGTMVGPSGPGGYPMSGSAYGGMFPSSPMTAPPSAGGYPMMPGSTLPSEPFPEGYSTTTPGGAPGGMPSTGAMGGPGTGTSPYPYSGADMAAPTSPATGGTATGGTGTPATTGAAGGDAGTAAPTTGAATDGTTAAPTGGGGGTGTLAGLGAEATAGALAAPGVIGDLMPFYSKGSAFASSTSPPYPPGVRKASVPYPSVRNFKISENQSPRPQDRVFFDFNFYSNINAAVNRSLKIPINNMNAYTYLWGFEKTFAGGDGSFGMRLPLNAITAQGATPGVNTPNSSALGNLDIFVKYILCQNYETGSLISAGMALTPTTGTSRFAGAPYVASLNTTYFQPFIAYLWRADRFYLQGFAALDAPVSNTDVTLFYNDISTGYFVYRNDDYDRLLTAVVPTFEVHVNSPLNHRNPYNGFDVAGTANMVNLTYGVNLMFYRRSMLTAALVTPVSSPKPFDAEFALFFNFYFGRTARTPAAITPPVVQ